MVSLTFRSHMLPNKRGTDRYFRDFRSRIRPDSPKLSAPIDFFPFFSNGFAVAGPDGRQM